MKELRTIKDLIKDYDDTQTGNKIADHNVYLFMRNLKQEAIKWVKNLNRFGCKKEILNGKFKDYECGFSYEGMIPICSNCESKINWIINFFNLTDDEVEE